MSLSKRFRGFLPVVVDVETAGFDPVKDALLEIAVVILRMDDVGVLQRHQTYACHVEPFPGANLDERALAFTGIDPFHPFRFAKKEREALETVFKPIQEELKVASCTRAVLVGHNPFFDLGFIKAATERCKLKKNPFHSFTTFDTATLGGLAYGQTVLARAAGAAGIHWESERAHSAIYDAEKTADLFCTIVNTWQAMEHSHKEVKNRGKEE